jgi:hypothetical protein
MTIQDPVPQEEETFDSLNTPLVLVRFQRAADKLRMVMADTIASLVKVGEWDTDTTQPFLDEMVETTEALELSMRGLWAGIRLADGTEPLEDDADNMEAALHPEIAEHPWVEVQTPPGTSEGFVPQGLLAEPDRMIWEVNRYVASLGQDTKTVTGSSVSLRLGRIMEGVFGHSGLDGDEFHTFISILKRYGMFRNRGNGLYAFEVKEVSSTYVAPDEQNQPEEVDGLTADSAIAVAAVAITAIEDERVEPEDVMVANGNADTTILGEAVAPDDLPEPLADDSPVEAETLAEAEFEQSFEDWVFTEGVLAVAAERGATPGSEVEINIGHLISLLFDRELTRAELFNFHENLNVSRHTVRHSGPRYTFRIPAEVQPPAEELTTLPARVLYTYANTYRGGGPLRVHIRQLAKFLFGESPTKAQLEQARLALDTGAGSTKVSGKQYDLTRDLLTRPEPKAPEVAKTTPAPTADATELVDGAVVDIPREPVARPADASSNLPPAPAEAVGVHAPMTKEDFYTDVFIDGIVAFVRENGPFKAEELRVKCALIRELEPADYKKFLSAFPTLRSRIEEKMKEHDINARWTQNGGSGRGTFYGLVIETNPSSSLITSRPH